MKWQIIHIPGKPEYSKEQSTVDVFASQVEPKLANALVRRLNQVAPLENLRHAKRVQKVVAEGQAYLSVALCLSQEKDQLDNIPTDVQELIKVHKLHPFVTQVAKYAASSKEEWEEQCKLWPTSYHPPTHNIDGITGFSEEDSQSIFEFMKAAIKLCKSGHQSNQVITSACDQTYLWPPSTSQRCVESNECRGSADFVSNQSDANSLTSNGPLDSDDRSVGDIGAYVGVSCLHPWRWAEQLPSAQPQTNLLKCGSSFSWHPLHHAAIVAVEQAAARDRKLFPSSELSTCQDDERCDASTNRFTSVLMRPYLCTGLDIYLVWEPCTMCAMALVHQRIRRIFFAFPNPHAGALGSVHRLQGERSLNHHYAVFRIALPVDILEEMTSNDANPLGVATSL